METMTKFLNKILMLAVLLYAAGCSDDNSREINLYKNKHDEAVVKRILKHCGINDKHTKDKYAEVIWLFDNETLERRVMGLNLVNNTNDVCTVPEEITELPFLRELLVQGQSFQGRFIDLDGKLPLLQRLVISNTSISSIPDNIFRKSFSDASIRYNQNITEIPSSIHNLPDIKDHIYDFSYNSFSGPVPLDLNIRIILDGNDFEYIDWEKAEGRIYNFSPEQWKNRKTFSLIWNKLRGTIPDYILNDSLGIYRLNLIADPQQQGYGFDNMPTDFITLDWNANTYLLNHPEYYK